MEAASLTLAEGKQKASEAECLTLLYLVCLIHTKQDIRPRNRIRHFYT